MAEKVAHAVGPYLNLPDKALELALDEKGQIQALDRSQPGLAMKKGRAGTTAHEYKRHGTTTLYTSSRLPQPKAFSKRSMAHEMPDPGESGYLLNASEQ